MSALDQIAGGFDRDRRPAGSGIATLVISDYLACYWQRSESPRRLALLFLPRLLSNPELHATTLIRIALGGPRILHSLWRSALIAKHSIDLLPEVMIGPGLRLPHPTGIVIGWAAVIGSDVTIYHNVTIGSEAKPRDLREPLGPPRPASEWRPCPALGDGVIVYTGSLVTGSITIGPRAVVGAHSWLDHDLGPDEVHRGRREPQPVR